MLRCTLHVEYCIAMLHACAHVERLCHPGDELSEPRRNIHVPAVCMHARVSVRTFVHVCVLATSGNILFGAHSTRLQPAKSELLHLIWMLELVLKSLACLSGVLLMLGASTYFGSCRGCWGSPKFKHLEPKKSLQ